MRYVARPVHLCRLGAKSKQNRNPNKILEKTFYETAVNQCSVTNASNFFSVFLLSLYVCQKYVNTAKMGELQHTNAQKCKNI